MPGKSRDPLNGGTGNRGLTVFCNFRAFNYSILYPFKVHYFHYSVSAPEKSSQGIQTMI